MDTTNLLQALPTRLADAVIDRTSTAKHAIVAGGALFALGISNAVLTSSYEASNHPVGYAEGQLAFDGATIQGYYAHMSSLDTLDTYVATQLIDFGFIAAVAAVGTFCATLIARGFGRGSLGRWAASFAGLLLIVGAGFDTLENLISFVMLADIDGFARWIAIPYSSAAAVKFTAIGAGMLLLGASLLGLVAKGIRRLAWSSGLQFSDPSADEGPADGLGPWARRQSSVGA